MSIFTLPEDRKGTDYYEFYPGKPVSYADCWSPKSLLLKADSEESLECMTILMTAVPSFDPYGITCIDKDTWSLILEYKNMENTSLYEEWIPWAENALESYGCFTILGL